MVSEKIAQLINEQIAHEQYAAQYYLSMSAWFSAKDLDGIANYFRVQSKEELMHADKMFDYLNDVGGEIIVGEIPKPPHVFDNAVDGSEAIFPVYFFSFFIGAPIVGNTDFINTHFGNTGYFSSYFSSNPNRFSLRLSCLIISVLKSL